MKPSEYKLPVFFHNLKGYDSHFLIKVVDPKIHGEVSAIPQSSEKYILFRVGNLIFKDSLSFLLASLESCASKLKEEDLLHTRRYFREQALTNKIPVIDASIPPTSTSRPVQSETATNDIENDDENVACRKLADILQVFRKMCLSYYRIDPAHCYTTPGLSWQAALRMTDV